MLLIFTGAELAENLRSLPLNMLLFVGEGSNYAIVRYAYDIQIGSVGGSIACRLKCRILLKLGQLKMSQLIEKLNNVNLKGILTIDYIERALIYLS